MGMFRDLREGVQSANEAMSQAAALQQQAMQGAAWNGAVPGTATVVGVTDTGTSVNGEPVLELDLAVSIPGRETYRTKHRQVVGHAALGRFQPGCELSVRASAHDPNQVMLG